MTNPYKKYLDEFFKKLLYYRHISGKINKVFQKDIQEYTAEKATLHFTSALVISDWTGPTDNGWEINFHTGIVAETTKDKYETEIKKISSRQLCLLYAQSFESFESFLKDCLYEKLRHNDILREYTISLLPKNQRPSFSRERMPSGDNLFKVLKKTGGESFKKFTSENNINIKFSELWTILSEVRHSITHKESFIESVLVNKSNHHSEIFRYLFDSKDFSENLLLIELDYKKFEKLIKRFSEFAFQVFKVLSIEEQFEWKNKNYTQQGV